jgi:hypothetical protein
MTHAIVNDNKPYLVVDSPYEVARWRPLVNWVLYIPHAIILGALQALSGVVFFIYWLTLIFTGTLHPGMYSVMAMYERYNARSGGFLLGYTETYAPFDFDANPSDNGAYPPIRLELPEVASNARRSDALNVFLAIPHYFVMIFYFIGAGAVGMVGWFAVLFTGKWPTGMRDFLVRVSNYYYRVWTYATMVHGDYPKFGLPDR